MTRTEARRRQVKRKPPAGKDVSQCALSMETVTLPETSLPWTAIVLKVTPSTPVGSEASRLTSISLSTYPLTVLALSADGPMATLARATIAIAATNNSTTKNARSICRQELRSRGSFTFIPLRGKHRTGGRSQTSDAIRHIRRTTRRAAAYAATSAPA